MTIKNDEQSSNDEIGQRLPSMRLCEEPVQSLSVLLEHKATRQSVNYLIAHPEADKSRIVF